MVHFCTSWPAQQGETTTVEIVEDDIWVDIFCSAVDDYAPSVWCGHINFVTNICIVPSNVAVTTTRDAVMITTGYDVTTENTRTTRGMTSTVNGKEATIIDATPAGVAKVSDPSLIATWWRLGNSIGNFLLWVLLCTAMFCFRKYAQRQQRPQQPIEDAAETAV